MVIGIATISRAAIRIIASEGVDAADAVVLQTSLALFTVWSQARRVLSANTDAVADFDAFLDFGADANCLADDFVADAYWIRRWAPSAIERQNVNVITLPEANKPRTESVQVTAADSGVLQ